MLNVNLGNGKSINVENWTEMPKGALPIAWKFEHGGKWYQLSSKVCDDCVPIYKEEDLLVPVFDCSTLND